MYSFNFGVVLQLSFIDTLLLAVESSFWKLIWSHKEASHVCRFERWPTSALFRIRNNSRLIQIRNIRFENPHAAAKCN